jgi:poly-gamma-glutamate synthase PgsB/CapB
VATPLLCCLLVLIALGLAERWTRDRAHRAIPIRVHVNGTRGKSTVTRLVWSALREAGVPCLAKTTGTAARVLYPDGTEHPAARRGPANIREQLVALRTARRLGARAVVLECMALDPALQYVSERHIVRSTIGVVTNVRHDHTEIMGNDLDAIASTLANTVPVGGVLVVGDPRDAARFDARAAALKTTVVAADPRAPAAGATARPALLAENIATALAVTRQLGLPDAVALRGFAVAPPDPGTLRAGDAALPDGVAAWVDASAANDPESLARLVDVSPAVGRDGPEPPRIVVYNHRPDRGPRLSCFADRSPTFADASRLVVTGARPAWTLWRHLRLGQHRARPVFVPRARLASWLRPRAAGAAIIFCGNARGLDVPDLIERLVSGG